MPFIIPDTTLLDAVYKLQILELLPFLYNRVFISTTVEREFLSEENEDRDQRYSFLTIAYNTLTWLEKCNTFDDALRELLAADPKIHPGEAEVIAQSKSLETFRLSEDDIISVLDERRAREVAKNIGLRIVGTLRILAKLHFLHL
jgi:predicted nucleic acid-binding protein